MTQLESVVRPHFESGELSELCTPTVSCALHLLGEAASCADRNSRDRWELAINIRRLLELGVSENDLLFLVQKRFVAHAQEIQATKCDGHTFRMARDLSFTNQSCFILTENGVELAKRLYAEESRIHVGYRAIPCAMIPSQSVSAITPKWDGCVLAITGVIVKRFVRPAQNQQTILSAFQEEGWPKRIDDPLSPVAMIDSKRRLNEAIKSLNQHHCNHLIRFRGDGTAQGVSWEALAH